MKNILYFIILSLFVVSCDGSKKISSSDMDFRAVAPQAGPAPTISLEKPATFQLDNGLTVIVVENTKLPTVNTSLYFDIPSLVEGDKAGMTSFVGPVMRAGTKNFTKEQLDEELDFYAIDFFSGSRSIGFSSLKKQMPKAVGLMSEILFNSTYENQDELDKLITQSVTGLESSTKNPDAIMSRVGNALMYGAEHPWGEFATADTYQNVSLADLRNYHSTYFKPNIAYLTIVGDITLPEARRMAEENFSDWQAGDVPDFSYTTPSNPSTTEVAIVDLPTATQSNIYVTNLENLAKANSDYFAATLGNHMLGGSSFAKLFLNLREDKGYTYGSYSQLANDDKMPSRFNAYGKFRNEVTDSSIMELMKELNGITSNPLTVEELQTAKNEQTGRFALGLERPETVARFARTVLLEDLDDDFYSSYLKNLNAQSPTQVLKAMRNYVKPNNARIIIVGKAADIADDVKALGYPVKFYDIWANEVNDPTIKADVGEVDAFQVINKSIEASGGKDAWSAVNSMIRSYNVEVQGLPLQLFGEIKVMSPNKSAFELSADNMGVLNKVVFDGTYGYTSSQGQKTPMADKEILAAKNKNVMLEELNYDANSVRIDNIVDVDGEQAYKVILTDASGEKVERFYSQESGLLLRTVEISEVQGQQIANTTTFSDYKSYDGKMIATNLKVEAGPQTIIMKLADVKFNEGVSESDFE